MASDETEVKILELEQRKLGEDLREIKDILKEVSVVVGRSALIEQKLTEITAAISRAHSRIDDHEIRIRKAETGQASNQWIERVVMAVLMVGVVAWAKGGIGG